MADQFPEKFGKYKILEEAGRGGFATVYKAMDTTLDRTVALKFLEPQLLRESTFIERFQREARLAAKLQHPNVVLVHEFGWEAGAVYMAMEFLEGQTLKEVLLKEAPLPPARIVSIVRQIASALDYAHGRGLVHRDIKPSNIMVGADDHVTVMGFGIAKAAALTALTTTGRSFGTPEYMSPEQAEGVEEPDARSDVYSLGVVIYEMFTGVVPFSDTTPLAILRGHADKPPPRPLEINPAVSPEVEVVLLKALAKKREERYQSAGAMARALAAVEARAEPKVERKKPEPVRPPRHAPLRVTVPEAVRPPTVMERLQPFEPEMILIPAGEFLMGSDPRKDKDARDDEQPQHTLSLPDYYLARTPVTNTQYAAFVQATGYKEPEHRKGIFWKSGEPPGGKEDHPVVNVSWRDAVAYCRWLAEVTGRPYRLPSEAEWEKGARGSDGRIYPWGDRWNVRRCNASEGSKGDTTPVEAYPKGASPYGLLDMAGNVWEWTRSLWGENWERPSFKYPYAPADGREDPDAPDSVCRVLRGGAFYRDKRSARCAFRGGRYPYYFRRYGFRVVAAGLR